MNELQALRAELNNERRARQATETELYHLHLRAGDSEKRAERAERLLQTTTERCKWFFNLSQRLEEERAVAQEDAERQLERALSLEGFLRRTGDEITRLEGLLDRKIELIEQAAVELERLDRSRNGTTVEKSYWRRLLYAAVNDIKGRGGA